MMPTKQAFWETPRNITILLTTVAIIAGVVGFKLGRDQPPPVVILMEALPG